ncbi:MAG: NAD-dependent deacylase [bacterium]
MNDKIERAGGMIAGAGRIAVFTGAGISTESGIPDFRSPGGVWSRYRIVQYPEFMSSRAARAEYWKMKCEGYPDFQRAKPNPAHTAIVELERMGKLLGLITQNIDGLHHVAGNSEEKIVELHGNNRRVRCQSCREVTTMENAIERIEAGDDAPECLSCGGYLKPDTISFGQQMPVREMELAHEWSTTADLFIVVGSSLAVEPAASFPVIAKRSGAKLLFINMTATPLDTFADCILTGKAGEMLPRAVAAAKNT